MNYYGTKNLAASWRTVRGNTLQIAEEIPAEKYNFRATPDTMSVAEMLAHMVTATYWAVQAHFVDKKTSMTSAEFGAYFGEANAMAQKLTTKDDIVAALKERGEDLAERLDIAPESMLGEMVQLPFGEKSRFEMLLGLKEHEMHHRAQLMQLERQIGIVPHLTRARQERAAATANA